MKFCPNCFRTKSFQQNVCTACGFRNSVVRDVRALPAEMVLNKRYLVGRVLGIGGFGITYIAYDMMRKERIAIKEYFPAEWVTRQGESNQIIPNSQSQEKYYQHGREKFIEEARVLKQLQDVDNIVNVRTLFEENGGAYMVMDFLDGYTLSGYLRANNTRSIPYENANQIILSAGAALHRIHRQGLLHRDVSPDNIMITKSGKIYLIDFGSARMYALNSPKSKSVLVKPGFAPLEQYSRAGNQGPWTDVYALAATYYYLTAGKKPPEAPERITGVPVIPLKNVVSNIPDQISDAIDHALEEQWDNRPRNVKDFMVEMGLLKNKQQLAPTEWRWSIHWDVHGDIEKKEIAKPCVLMQVGLQRQRYYFAQDDTLSIGRKVGIKQGCIQINEDKQVSGLHCKIWYDSQNNRFAIQNYSGNKTYTSRGILDKNQTLYLLKGEWVYVQTMKDRYIFYLEVE